MTQQLNTEVVPEWTLGDRLRKARELTGLDAVQFADAILVHRDTVANYEKGKISHPRRMVLEAWSRHTGVSLSWLQTGETPRPAGGPDGASEVRHQGLEPRTRWFGRTGERRGFMPIADPARAPHPRRALVLPLAAVEDDDRPDATAQQWADDDLLPAAA